MTLYILRRILQSVFVALAMSMIVFVGLNVVGNPVDILMPADASQQDIADAIARLGLDRPLHEQYLVFLKNAVTGNLGISFVNGQSALATVLERLPATLELAVVAMVLALAIGIPLGFLAGLRPNSLPAKTIMSSSIVAFSLPTFWIGIVFIMVFAVHLGWLPSGGRGQTVSVLGLELSVLTINGLKHIILPALTLSLFKIALIIRLTAAGTTEVAGQDYVKFARAKGVKRGRITYIHILKNVILPVMTVSAMEFGNIIAFSVVTETVYSWPGMGKLLIDAIRMVDRPVVVAYLIVCVLIFMVLNLIVDIVYSILDPRISLKSESA